MRPSANARYCIVMPSNVWPFQVMRLRSGTRENSVRNVPPSTWPP
jgi:hypothetical protein